MYQNNPGQGGAMEHLILGKTLSCLCGDIACQPDIDAVVNAANAFLRSGGGVAGALHRAAGPGLEKECLPLGPIKPGEAVITGAHRLPNKFVIHCLGPVYGADKPEEELLSSCYREALHLAEIHEIRSVAFPALSTGIFGYPAEEAAFAALNTVLSVLPVLNCVEYIRFVLYTPRDLALYVRILGELLREREESLQERADEEKNGLEFYPT